MYIIHSQYREFGVVKGCSPLQYQIHIHTCIHVHTYNCTYLQLVSFMDLSLPSLPYVYPLSPSIYLVAGRYGGDQANIDPQVCTAVGQMISSAFPTSRDELADTDTAMQVVKSIVEVLQDTNMLVEH